MMFVRRGMTSEKTPDVCPLFNQLVWLFKHPAHIARSPVLAQFGVVRSSSNPND